MSSGIPPAAEWKHLGVPVGEVLAGAAFGLANTEILEMMEPGRLLLFMGLGLWISWAWMRNMTNAGCLAESEARMKALRPRQK